MIKPVNVKLGGGPDVEQMAALETAADRSITAAERNQAWPAKVRTLRMHIERESIAAVAAKYRAEGWIVLVGDGDTTCYFTIDHPERKP